MKTPTPDKSEHPFRSARRAAVPIMAIETADPLATIRACGLARNGKPDAFLKWDCIRGLIPLGGKDASRAEEICADIGEPVDTQNLPQCLALIAQKQPKDCTIFIQNAHAALSDPTVLQAIWNCRDELKACGSTLVLLGPALKLPPELANDVPLFEEPAPTPEDIEAKIDGAVKDGKKATDDFPEPTTEEREKIRATLTGYLSLYPIEQSLALATTAKGINLRKLWELKVAQLKNTSGLEISQPEVTFKDLAGCYGAKDFLGMLFKGRQRIQGVFWLEEIEKMLAGGSGDTSGTTQALIEQFLFWTESKKVLGLLFVGVPGSGKSFTAQCAAGEAQVPILRGSMSSVKGSLVGQSEANMRNMLKTVDSVTGGRPLMIATCNSLDVLTPEIMARFKLGTMVFDFPTAEESVALWNLYRTKYELDKEAVPVRPESRWVGREIESCCHRAWMFQVPLAKAAESVVSVARANANKMEALRKSMSGRFLSAAYPGIYQSEAKSEAKKEGAESRNLSL